MRRLNYGAIAGLLLAGCEAVCQDGLFETGELCYAAARSFAAGERPFALESADLSGDNIPDLLVVNRTENTVRVLLGRSDGSFASLVPVEAGLQPIDAALGDLDNDGDLDAVVSTIGIENDSAPDVLVVLQNDGTGILSALAPVQVGDLPFSLQLGDWDGDGILDIASINNFSAQAESLSVLKGNGDGTFAPHVLANAAIFPNSLASGDLDGDGDIDLAATNGGGQNRVAIVINETSFFALRNSIQVGSAPLSLAIADLDNDGDNDIVTSNLESHDLSILRNDGASAFTVTSAVFLGSNPFDVKAVDINQDGLIDLVSANEDNDTIKIVTNLGDLTFSTPTTLKVGDGPVALQLIDISQDGALDIVTANQGSNDVSVVFSNP